MQSSVSPPSSPLIWFLLLESATGQSYKGTTASAVLRSSLVVPVVDQFRDAVHQDNSAILTGITFSQLQVYKNKASFDKRNAAVGQEKQEPLEEDAAVYGLGKTEEEALIVVIPSAALESIKGSGQDEILKERNGNRVYQN